MKYVVVLGDGMSGWKIPSLDNKTCIEAAKTPALDKMAPLSEIGLCKTVPDRFKPGSDIANMSVLGFDTERFFTGRSPLEAVAMGIELKDTDVTLRCNFVTLSDEEKFEDKTMLDYSAGDITTAEAQQLLDDLKILLDENHTLYTGVSYKHCLVVNNGVTGHDLTPPHDISDKQIKDYLPKGPFAKTYLEMMKKSFEILKDHPVNLKRISEGKNPANSIWLWGEGTKPALENFEKLRGAKGGIISAVDLVKGLGICAGLKVIEVPDITANYKTNFSGKAKAAAEALIFGGLDFVYVHIDAADECAHHGDVGHKVYSIEQIDGVVKTISDRLTAAGEDFAMLVCPDHPTPCALKTHTSEPIPYLLYTNVKNLSNGASRYSESEAEKTGLYIPEGHKLIDRLFSIK
ncbi:MAG: cofactor-independent phosphoglycerate mutase [Clostridia bacterium]|nr:cofactor-independent phosphoglycerate mutase [Clostridia bacterium]